LIVRLDIKGLNKRLLLQVWQQVEYFLNVIDNLEEEEEEEEEEVDQST